MESQPRETIMDDGELLQETSVGTPNVQALLTTAATHQQSNIVGYLLTTYTTLSLSQHTDIAECLIASGNVSILKALLTHDSNFASISLDSGMRTFLTEACLSPSPKTTPLIHVLLEAGADVNDGLGPGGGALLAAIKGAQEKDVVVKIVRKGGIVSQQVIYTAVEKERVDILPLLLRMGGGGVDEQKLGSWAKKTGNETVEALIEAFREGGTGRMAKYEMKGEEKGGEKSSWWKVWKSEK